MRGLLLLPTLALLPAPAARPAAPPRRIVSLNLCADQYLLALADRDQIAALTRNARDPAMSAFAARAAGMPIVRDTAEPVLALRPDLVIGSSRGRMGKVGIAGATRLDLGPANSFAEIVEQVRTVGTAIGHPERAERLVAEMERALARIPHDAGQGAVAAYYQRRGFLTGTGTLIDDLMRRVGLVNLAARLHKPPLAYIGLEELAAARPDYLIVETATDRVTDQGTEMLHHPLIAGMARLRLPQAWTVCGGPGYVKAAASLAAQLRAAKRR